MPEPGKSKEGRSAVWERFSNGGGLRSQLLKGGVASGLIQGVNRMLALVLGIFLARFLGAEGYGVYAHAMAVLTLLVVLTGLGFPSLLMREVAAGHVRQDWGLIRGILKRSRQIAFLVSGSVAACGVLFVWYQSESLSVAQFYTLLFSLLLVPLATLSKNQLFVLRGMDRVTLALLFELLLQPLVALTCVGVLFLLSENNRSPEFAMMGQMVAVMVSLAGVFLVLKKIQPVEMRHASEAYKTKTWLKSAIPFTLIGGAGILHSQTDILMLGWLRSADEVGVYRVAVQGAVLVAFGLVALDAVVAPHFARLHSQNDRVRLQRLVTLSARAIFISALPVVLVFVFAGGKLASWVFGAEFENSHFPLAVLSVAHLVNASMGSVGYLLNMTGHEKDSANVLMLTAVLNVLLNAVLIPVYGFEGAAVATAISIVSWKVMLAVLVRKRLGLNSTAFARFSR